MKTLVRSRQVSGICLDRIPVRSHVSAVSSADQMSISSRLARN
jgi:hypothetical protein